MLRSHTCGELRINNIGLKVSLCGWVQKVRDKGKMIWIDLRDRYGVTQLIFQEEVTSKKNLQNGKRMWEGICFESFWNCIREVCKK